jgi:phosphate transport system permease protein
MSRSNSDTAVLWGLRAMSMAAALVVVLITVFVAMESLPALQRVGVLRFLSDPSWHPNFDHAEGRFNLVPMIAGTLLATAGALLIAAPLGVICALFMQFYAPPAAARGFQALVALLAGIPSVAYGFWGLVVLAPILRSWQPPGQSLLTASLILAIMILPTIALLAHAAFAAVPAANLRGAAALGLSRWATIRGVVFPSAYSGLITAVLLATGRAVGETMAVLMVAGNVVQVPASVFDPVRTLTANIALELGYAAGDHRSALFVSGLALLGLTAVLVLLSEAVMRGRQHG